MTVAAKIITAVVPKLALPRAAVPRQIMPPVMATTVTEVPARYRLRVVNSRSAIDAVAVAVAVDLPSVVVALACVPYQPGLAQNDDHDNYHSEGPAEPVLPRLEQGHVEVVGDEGEEPHGL